MGWKEYEFFPSITIQYPESWWPVWTNPARLVIRNIRGGSFNSSIGHDQAEIFVSVMANTLDTLDEVVASDSRGTTLLEDRTISVETLRPNETCSLLREIAILETHGPYAMMINTEIFCYVGKTRLNVLLHTWQEETKLEDYRRIAEEMAKSFVQSAERPRHSG